MAHVLVVDDEGDSREFVARFLQRMGHQVSTAQDGRDALRQLLGQKPDVVVLDVRMPELDGVGLLEVMRSYLRWHALPVVIVSAHATGDEIDRARRMGVRHVLHKAVFKLEELSGAIDDATRAPSN
jgi:two-component system response regulator (stage 0 sporulation protein F)